MKKICCIILSALLALTLAACGNNPDNSSTDNDGTKPTINETAPSSGSQPGEKDAPKEDDSSEPTSNTAWVIKDDIQAPVLPETIKVTDKVTFPDNDAVFNMKLYKAPWSELDPDKIQEDLKALPFFDGWSWSREYEEKGYAGVFTDVGEHRNYDYSITINAQRRVDGITERFYVYFTAETNAYSGWRSVALDYTAYGQEMDAEVQTALLDVLKVVYGDYSEYMLYAPENAPRGVMQYSVENECGENELSRRMDDDGVHFSAYAFSSLRNSWDNYAGDYVSVLKDKTPEYFTELFSTITPLDFDNVEEIGSDFFSEYFDKYDSTSPDNFDKMYTYHVEEYENGDKSISFDMGLFLYQTDTSYALEGMDFKIKYEIDVVEDAIKKLYINFISEAACMDEVSSDPSSETTRKWLQKNLDHAKVMANAVFGTNYSFDEIYWNSSKDNNLTATDKITLLGKEKDITFEFVTRNTSAGKYRSWFEITIR